MEAVFALEVPAVETRERLVGFVDEIVWCYAIGGKSRRGFGRKHDTILWYAKDAARYTFRPSESDRLPYMAPGLVGAEKAARGQLCCGSLGVRSTESFQPLMATLPALVSTLKTRASSPRDFFNSSANSRRMSLWRRGSPGSAAPKRLEP